MKVSPSRIIDAVLALRLFRYLVDHRDAATMGVMLSKDAFAGFYLVSSCLLDLRRIFPL